MPDSWDSYFAEPAVVAGGAPAGDWESYFPETPAPGGPVSAPSLSAAPAQLGGWERYPVLAGQALARGLVRTAGLPGDLLALAGLPQLSPEQQAEVARVGGIAPNFPTTEQLTSLIGPSGALGTASTIPQPGFERFGTGALEGLGADLPFILAGEPEAIPLRAGISGSGALAGEAAHEYAPGVSLAGPVAGALAGGSVQGVRNLLAGDPFQRVARSLDASSENWEDAGTALQNWGEKFRDPNNPSGMNAQIESSRGALESALPYQVTVPTDNLIANIQQIYDKGGRGKAAVQAFLKRTADRGGILGNAAKTVQTNMALPQLGIEPTPLPWGDSFALRSELGAEYRGATDPRENAALKFLYSGHTQDLGQAAAGAGAGDEWNNFNKISTELHDLNEGPVARLLRAGPGAVASSLFSGAKKEGTDLQALRQAGAPVNELSAALLRGNPGGWKNLSPGAKEALVEDPQARALLESASVKKPSKLLRGIHATTGMTAGELIGAGIAHVLGMSPLEGGLVGGLGAGGLEIGARMLPGLAGAAFRPNMLGAELLGLQAGRQVPEVSSEGQPQLRLSPSPPRLR